MFDPKTIVNMATIMSVIPSSAWDYGCPPAGDALVDCILEIKYQLILIVKLC